MLEKYYRIKQAAGVSINIGADGGTIINLCSVVAETGQLNLDKKVNGLRSLEDLRKQLPEQCAIALNFSGKGVLYKQIEKIDVIDKTNFNKVLPNGNFDDFYLQNFVSANYSFIALIRKSDIDRWVQLFDKVGLKPHAVSLGPFAVYNIIDLLNFYDGDIVLDGHVITRDEKNNWIVYHYDSSAKSQFPVKLASEHIDEALVIPYAAAFQLILSQQLETIKLAVPPLDERLEKTLASQKLKVQSFLMLIGFFLLLLINYGILSWLSGLNSKLGAQATLNDQNSDSLSKIVELSGKKEAKLNALGWDGGVNKSALIDQVASLLPGGITVSEIDVNPIDQVASRNQKTIGFKKKQLQIRGNSDQIIPVNEWIARIRSRRWVKNVRLDSYVVDNEHNTGVFLIKIDY